MTSIAIIHFVARERRETPDNMQQLIVKIELQKIEQQRMDLLTLRHVPADYS